MNTPDTGVDVDPGAGPGPARAPSGGTRLQQLADEQEALRRVATLVAGGARPAEVFSAIADELGRLVGADATFVTRVEFPSGEAPRPAGEDAPQWAGDLVGSCVVVSSHGSGQAEVPVDYRFDLVPGTSTATALLTGRPARVSADVLAATRFGDLSRRLGLRAAIAAPIVVDGRYWGVTLAVTTRADFPPGTESRTADFTELAATAIANADAEHQLRELAETHAALRRLAMLVARGEPPDVVFSAATREVRRYFGGDTARMIRYELDGTATLVANEGTSGPHVRVGKRWEGFPPTGLTATVRETGRPARVDDYRELPGGEPYAREGLRSAVAMPILVNGRLWGTFAVGSSGGPLPPGTEQRMMDFTDLVATAIANAQSRADLMTSRARVVAASDEARRRIERELHDRVQTRLVALAHQVQSVAAAVPPGCEDIQAELTELAAGLMTVVRELREISGGIHPAILTEAGLRPALQSLARRSIVPVELNVQTGERMPEQAEVAAYYVVSEMLTNAARHACASAVTVTASVSGDMLQLRVADDGVGGADPARGSGLVGLKDRVEALGGTFSVHSPPGGGTTVHSRLPVTDHPGREPADPQ